MAKKNISSPKPFNFKQFSIYHHKSTMKVGTDAILLATWCNTDNVSRILDIGTGCGVIALLLAARSQAEVDAIEFDKNSAEEATDNFRISQYSNRLHLYETDFNKFAQVSDQKYDLIISNPPYFSGDLLPNNPSRKAARHTNKLTHKKLCEGVEKLLTKDGRFCLVLPSPQSDEFIKMASLYNLFIVSKQLVFPKPNLPHNRVNMEFRFGKPSIITIEDITVRNDDGQHTDEYKKYVDAYLTHL